MLQLKGKCVIGNTSLLLTIVACFSIAAADMKLGNIKTSKKHLWERLSNVTAQYLSEPLLKIKHQKQLEVLTIPKHGDNDLFTYLVFNFLYDHLTTNWNLIEWLRKRSNDQHLSGSVEHLNDHHLIMVYDEELFGFQNMTDKQMMEAYSEILKSFTKSEPDSHNLNGGDRILPDHLGSIMGIEATVLLTLLLLSNLSIRIVNKKDCSKASSSHSKILKVAAKERRQNFPTENQAKGVRLCEMCVNQNSTVAHCKTCKLYICTACSILHERVWALMNHTLCPFKEI